MILNLQLDDNHIEMEADLDLCLETLETVVIACRKKGVKAAFELFGAELIKAGEAHPGTVKVTQKEG